MKKILDKKNILIIFLAIIIFCSLFAYLMRYMTRHEDELHKWTSYSSISYTTQKYDSNGNEVLCTTCRKCKTNITEIALNKLWEQDPVDSTVELWKESANSIGDAATAKTWHRHKYNCTGTVTDGNQPWLVTATKPAYEVCSKCGAKRTKDNSHNLNSDISQGSVLYDINGTSLGRTATNVDVYINEYCWQNGLTAKYFTKSSYADSCISDEPKPDYYVENNYIYDKNGNLVRSQIITVSGVQMASDGNGAVIKNKNFIKDGYAYKADAYGTVSKLAAGTHTIDNTKYDVDNNGKATVHTDPAPTPDPTPKPDYTEKNGYIYDKNDSLVKNQIVTVNGVQKATNGNGAVIKNTNFIKDGYAYNADSNGKVAKLSEGTYTIDGTKYTVDSSGKATVYTEPVTKKGTWKCNSVGWWYEYPDGSYPANKWLEIDGKWYYFLSSGYMDYSEYRDGYWLNADGSWNTAYSGGHWVGSDASGWWYTDNSGWYPVNQWLWIDGKNYHFDSAGWCTNPWI